MAFSGATQIASGASTTNNQTTLTVATTVAVSAGDLVVVCVAVDNRNSTGGDQGDVSGVTIGGVALTKGRLHSQALTAQTGASVSVWWGQPGAISSGQNIVATFATASTSDASALTARKFTVTSGNNVIKVGDDAIGGIGETTLASLDVTSPNTGALRVRAVAAEWDSTISFTVTSTWTAFTKVGSAATGTTGEMTVAAEHLISAGSTTAASAPTLGTACDSASVYVAWEDRAPIAGTTTFAGVGAQTSAATKIKIRTASQAGVGAMTSEATVIPAEADEVMGGGFGAFGELAFGEAFVPGLQIAGTTAYSAVGAMVSVASHTIPRTTTAAAVGTVTTTATRTAARSSTFAATGAMSSVWTKNVPRSTLVAAVGTMVTTATKTFQRTSAVAAIGTMASVATKTYNRTTLAAAVGAMSSAWTRTIPRTTAFGGVGTMLSAAAGNIPRTSTFAATGAMSSAATRTHHRTTLAAAVGTMTTTRVHSVPRTMLAAAVATMSSARTVTRNRTTLVNAVGAMSSTGNVEGAIAGATAFSGVGSMSSTRTHTIPRTTTITAIGSVSSSAIYIINRTTTFSASGTMTSAGTVVGPGEIVGAALFSAFGTMGSVATLIRAPETGLVYDFPIQKSLYGDYGLRASKARMRTGGPRIKIRSGSYR